MKGPTHFWDFDVATAGGNAAACGSKSINTTAEPSSVTCGSCRKTVAYKNVVEQQQLGAQLAQAYLDGERRADRRCDGRIESAAANVFRGAGVTDVQVFGQLAAQRAAASEKDLFFWVGHVVAAHVRGTLAAEEIEPWALPILRDIDTRWVWGATDEGFPKGFAPNTHAIVGWAPDSLHRPPAVLSPVWWRADVAQALTVATGHGDSPGAALSNAVQMFKRMTLPKHLWQSPASRGGDDER